MAPPADGAAGATTVTNAVLRDWPLPSPGGGHGATKDARGQILVVGGARQTPGAVSLAAVAALRAGAGKLQVATVTSTAVALAVALPEAMVVGLPETADGALDASGADRLGDLAAGAAAVLVGPGLADEDQACGLLCALLPHLGEGTLVLDALGLANLSRDPSCLASLDGRVVLTPNEQEIAIMLDLDPDEVQADPGRAARTAAERLGAVVALGGPQSWISTPDGRAWCDETGGAGLGVSGSGDAMAGLVAGLAARGAEPAQAALWGVHVHGRCGDRLAGKVGALGYLARELPDQVPLVLAELSG